MVPETPSDFCCRGILNPQVETLVRSRTLNPHLPSLTYACGTQATLAAGRVAQLQLRLEAADLSLTGHAAELDAALAGHSAEKEQLKPKLQQLATDVALARQVWYPFIEANPRFSN